MPCTLRGWVALTKRVVCKGILAEVGMAWQVMTREPAQAGDRASRTEHYLQWWENSPEWEAEASAAEKQHNSDLGRVMSPCAPHGSLVDGMLRTAVCPASHVDGLPLPNG